MFMLCLATTFKHVVFQTTLIWRSALKAAVTVSGDSDALREAGSTLARSSVGTRSTFGNCHHSRTTAL